MDAVSRVPERTVTIDRSNNPSEKIGLMLTDSEDGEIYIDQIISGLAAHRSGGFMQGDKLVTIGSHSVQGATRTDIEGWLYETPNVVVAYEREFADMSEQMLLAASASPVHDRHAKATALKQKLISRRKTAEQVLKKRSANGSGSMPNSPEMPSVSTVYDQTSGFQVGNLSNRPKSFQEIEGIATHAVKVRVNLVYLLNVPTGNACSVVDWEG